MNISLILSSLPLLLKGAAVSLQIALSSIAIGLIGGTLLALALTSKSKATSWFVHAYVTLIRGTPLLIQIAFFHYVLPEIGIILPNMATAIIALGMNSSAYVSQIVYAGIKSVTRDQTEAAFVLGFDRFQIATCIVLPQAFRAIFPALTNEMVTLIKDSSLASIIGVAELYKEARGLISETYDVISIFFIVALLYLLLTSITAAICNIFARKFDIHA